MKRILLAVVVVAVVSVSAVVVRAAKEEIEFDEAHIFFEENATDGDLGLQFFFDGDGWQKVTITSPDGKKMVDIKVGGNAKLIGLTEIFSESEEPSFDELPRDELLALFPAGEYTIRGKTVEGDDLVGTATLTHTMPAAPVITSPEEDEVVDTTGPVVVRWNLVADPNPPDSVITGYHVVVELDEEGQPELAVSADLPATATSLTVPPEFLRPGRSYKVEVIATETSGNKTITEVPFTTAAP